MLTIEKPTIIYGAGSAGAQLVESLRKNHEYAPIAFIDDDVSKHGTFINFTKVYAFKELKNIIDNRNAKNILLAIPSLSANGKRDLLKNYQNILLKSNSYHHYLL